MPTPVAGRVQKRRRALRAEGLRQVQIGVSDTRAAGFAEECRRQAVLVAEADVADEGLQDLMAAAATDLDRMPE